MNRLLKTKPFKKAIFEKKTSGTVLGTRRFGENYVIVKH